jgi:hypothetical protein
MLTYEEFNENSNGKDYIHLYQEEGDVGGGKISIEDIDRINQYDNTDKVMISGLRQDTFEYFVKKYGHKIKYISFWGNKLVEDFSALSSLTKMRCISFFHNQRVSKLWDMSKNHHLEGLSIEDFTRLHSLDGVQSAPKLKHLHFGDKVWRTSILTDLTPLVDTKLVSFTFRGKKIVKNDIDIYTKMPTLKFLSCPYNFYTTEQLAQIVAFRPDISGNALVPYIKLEQKLPDGKDVLICGKGKPFLNSKKDAAKIEAYVNQFNELVENYKSNK